MKYTLKELRARNNKSQQELSEDTGISRTSINRIENGVQIPTVDKAVSIAKALNVKVEDIKWK